MSSTEKLQHDDDPESLFSVQVELKDPIPVVVPALQKDFDAGASSSLDPHQWSTWRKWTNVFIVAFQATLSPVCSTLVAVGSSDVDREFHVSNSSVSALPVALFVVGLGVGPLYLAPLSEMYGRRIVYIISLAMFCLFNLGGALVHNEVGFIILRLLAGLAGSAGPSLGGGTIGDMFSREERGGAQAVYAFGPTFGPAIGGLIGGYISQHAGWRWLPGIMAISSGVTTVISILFLKETYLPYLIARSEGKTSAPLTISFRHSISRPVRMLFLSPIVAAMSLYVAIIYGITYLHLETIPLLFGPTPEHGLFTYGWHHGNTGLAYLGAGTGCLVAIVTCMLVLNQWYRHMCKIHKAQMPEFRMPAMQLGILIVPAGLLIYGWTAEAQAHFLLPLFGASVFAFGMLMTFICIQTYLVDSFHDYAASALAATIVLRSIFGAIFTTFGASLYKALGYGWGTTVLALIAMIALPIPLLFWRYGQQLRERPFVP